MLTHLRKRFKCVTLTQAVQMFTHSVQMFTHSVQMFTQTLHANARRLLRTGRTVCKSFLTWGWDGPFLVWSNQETQKHLFQITRKNRKLAPKTFYAGQRRRLTTVPVDQRRIFGPIQFLRVIWKRCFWLASSCITLSILPGSNPIGRLLLGLV